MTIPYEKSTKTAVMTPDEELAAAKAIAVAKRAVWNALLDDSATVSDSLAFCGRFGPALRPKSHLRTSHFEALAVEGRRLFRRPIQANAAAFRRRRADVVDDVLEFDPCLVLAERLLRHVTEREIDAAHRESYEGYLDRIHGARGAWLRQRNRFIEQNIRLVMVIAKRYSSFGIPREDLVQEGVFGLQKAVGMFDISKGCKFSTYAAWWIRAAMNRYCRNRGRLIRTPVYRQEMLERYYAALRHFLDHGIEYDDEKIAAAMNVDVSAVEVLRQASAERIRSADAELAPGFSLGDLISDPKDHIADVEMEIGLDDIREAVASLPPREQTIIRRRFGLDESDAETLQEIASDFDLSRERVRQLEEKALETIRRYTRRKVNCKRLGIVLTPDPDVNDEFLFQT